jgi:hypothetical protein
MTLTPEEAVLGACLLDQSVIRLAVEHVMPSDFSFWKGEEIFTAIIGLHSIGQPVDVITVGAKLADAGSKIHPAELHRLVEQVPTAANVGFYAAEVRDAAVRRGLKAVAIKLAQSAENEMQPAGVTLAEGIAGLQSVRDDSPFSSLHGRTLTEVMAEDDEYDWVIKRLFERGDRMILTGGEGAGKSMLVRQMAIFAAAGIHPFWLSDIPPVDVVVIDRENSERQWRRKARGLFNMARDHGNADPGRLYLECDSRPMDLTRDSDLGYVHRVLDQHPCDVLVLGPLYKLVPRAVMTDDDAAPLQAALDSLRARGCALITEAHAGHDREKSLRPVGSSAWLRWPEFGRGIRKDLTQPGRVTFEQWRGDRDERSFPEAFTRGGFIPWTAEGVSPGLLARFHDPANQPSFIDRESAIGF